MKINYRKTSAKQWVERKIKSYSIYDDEILQQLQVVITATKKASESKGKAAKFLKEAGINKNK